MAKLADFGKLTKRFASLADFAIIYVEEAHPVDGWRFKVRFIKILILSLLTLHPLCEVMHNQCTHIFQHCYGSLNRRGSVRSFVIIS